MDQDGRRDARGSVISGAWIGIPELPVSYVRRDRLVERLERSRGRRLVLVSAPAGRGKTSLVSDWVRKGGAPEHTAWATFEPGDRSVWSALVRCLETLGVYTGTDQLPEGEVLVERRALPRLAERIAEHATRVTVVLDGLEVTSTDVGHDLDFLLRHSGDKLQLVLVSRSDPVMPLYRHRLEESMVEIRMADLACTDVEAGALLAASGVELGPESLRALNSRANGWVVGLRFAARHLARCEDPDAAVAEVVGDTGDIAEYLLGEVLDAQPDEARQLLLDTCVVDVLRPGLVEALSERSMTRALDLLTHDNAFIEPVPNHPGFYRYHPFFRDLLRAELAYEAPDHLHELHRTAARWFAEQGELAISVRHYAAIDDWSAAAGTVVDRLAVGELLGRGGPTTMRAAFDLMPDRVRGADVGLIRAAALLADGATAAAADELARVRRDLGEGSHDAPPPTRDAALLVLEALVARTEDDAAEALATAQLADHALAALSDPPARVAALAALVGVSTALALVRQGSPVQAREVLTAVASTGVVGGRGVAEAEYLAVLALLACLRGELSSAEALATRSTRAAEMLGLDRMERPIAAEVAAAWVELERGDPAAAGEHIAAASVSDFLAGDPVSRAALLVVGARRQAARGQTSVGLSMLEPAADAAIDPFVVELLHRELARLRSAAGDRTGALEALGRAADDAESELLRAELATASGRAAGLDKALNHAVDPSEPVHVQVDGWLLRSAEQLRRGNQEGAREALGLALHVAAPEMLRRPFRETEPRVRRLLDRDGVLSTRHRWLTDAPGAPLPVPTARPAAAGSPPVEDSLPVTLVEALTPKELEVLEHLAELMTTEEIAGAMFVSVNTVRTHVRSILRKLGVSRRNAAVRRARELHLLPV